MMEVLQLEFMQRALIAGLILAPLLSVLGSFVTLRKMAFFSDGIAHASLLGVALGIVADLAPFYGALLIGLIFGLLVFLLERYTKIATDAIIGIIFTTGLALGIILISLQPGYQPDLVSFLFGNILAITWGNVWIILILAIIILLTIFMLFRQLTLLSLSEELAWTSGVSTKMLDLLFYSMLSVSVVLGVKLLGIILVSALLITPAVTAKLITRSFSMYAMAAVLFALLAFILGLFGSYYFDIPSGASIVVSSTILFAVVFAFQSLLSRQNHS
jgi:ABC-type Mn2+/Zn2+ transport system permease subunit